uniref:Uncharacterized protein n=1 Tax=Myoviridae sp. ctwwN25 TaxID=2825209 RepID=A0A8S5PQ33_9CAUD|nr:MAG TPA: hypothetical protein [Myoviridae sp. ctwwN25]
MAEFSATARIPTRPLSYDQLNLAENKELIADYNTGALYVKKADGTVVDVSAAVKEVIIKEIQKDPNFSNNIQITINGDTYELSTVITKNVTEIKQIQDALGYYVDKEGNVKFDLLDKIAKIDPNTGKVEFTITADDVQETDNRVFLSPTEKESAAKATHPEIIKATILGGTQAWTGSDAPYTQKVTVTGIKETDVPVVDISLGDIYDTITKQLDSYAYIYKILTYDGYIMVYASQPTENDINIQMKVDRQ